MALFSSFFIAIGLAMDAMAVAVSSGVAVKRPRPGDASRLAVLFGVFQCVMLLIGWLFGASVSVYVEAVHHWVAFALLSFIGIRMAVGSRREPTGNALLRANPFALKNLLVMAFATSIDAFAAGVGLAVTGDFVWATALIVGLVAYLLSALGVKMGGSLGHMFHRRAELFGGVILILTGAKILLEHLL